MDEFDEYDDELGIDEMTDEELDALEAYENRDYSPEETEPVEFETTKEEIDAAFSKHKLEGYIERKGETANPEGTPLEQYEHMQVSSRTSRNPSVEYTEDTVRIDGRSVTGVYPVFDSQKDVQLPGDLRFASIHNQEKYCNAELARDVAENPDKYRDVFTKEQLEQIEKGKTPEGFTWHHHQDVGRMQLVDRSVHEANRHDGGFVLWGGQKR